MGLGTILEDCGGSRELLLKGFAERKDLLALPTGRLGPRREDSNLGDAGVCWNLKGATAGVCWKLKAGSDAGFCWNWRGASDEGVCWTNRERGLFVQAKSEQGEGVTITNCCAWNKRSISHFTHSEGIIQIYQKRGFL